jgi:hypothetical protein
MTNQDGNFVDNVTLSTGGSLDYPAAVKFDSERQVFFAQKDGTVYRWNGDTGSYEGSLPLEGYGGGADIGELEYNEGRGMAYAHGCCDFYITYNGKNEHLSFWSPVTGNRLYRYELIGAGQNAASLSYANGYALLHKPGSDSHPMFGPQLIPDAIRGYYICPTCTHPCASAAIAIQFNSIALISLSFYLTTAAYGRL